MSNYIKQTKTKLYWHKLSCNVTKQNEMEPWRVLTENDLFILKYENYQVHCVCFLWFWRSKRIYIKTSLSCSCSSLLQSLKSATTFSSSLSFLLFSFPPPLHLFILHSLFQFTLPICLHQHLFHFSFCFPHWLCSWVSLLNSRGTVWN